ncbi:MAG TPA: twin-arginine translocase TatA/TatE family subunit [Anaerolineae bacterium]|nr:twin-arginine translocase TatA/TatE family subunit [Anaerolineae bacterium]
MNVIGNIGLTEIIVIFLLALIVFGPERLPEIARKIGAVVHDLQRVYANLSRELGPELSALPTAMQEVRETAEAFKALPRDAIRALSQATTMDVGADGAVQAEEKAAPAADPEETALENQRMKAEEPGA